MPKVSIVLPVFNNEDDVLNSINSVINQSFKDWELIIVDDCSTDNSFEKIANHIQKFKKSYNIKLIKNERNCGTYVSKNIGILNSQGEYITFIDSDDTYHKDKIKHQVDVLDTKMVEVATIRYKVDNETIAKRSETMLMIRKSVVDRIGYYDSVRFAADSEYFCRIKKVYGLDAIFLINKVLYFAKGRKGSLTRNDKTGIYGQGKKIREEYVNQFTIWHQSNKELYMPFNLTVRPFPVDKIMLS